MIPCMANNRQNKYQRDVRKIVNTYFKQKRMSSAASELYLTEWIMNGVFPTLCWLHQHLLQAASPRQHPTGAECKFVTLSCFMPDGAILVKRHWKHCVMNTTAIFNMWDTIQNVLCCRISVNTRLLNLYNIDNIDLYVSLLGHGDQGPSKELCLCYESLLRCDSTVLS